jgi:cytochrome P450
MPSVGTVGFDPGDPAFVVDPYPVYAAMRAADGLLRNDDDRLPYDWVASRYVHVDLLLRHRSLGRVFTPRVPYERFAPWNLVNEHAMLELEPPDHTRLRTLVAHAVTPRRVEQMRTQVRVVADELVGRLAADGGGDIVHDLAEPLPVAVIATLLGIPDPDRQLLRPWSNAIVELYEPDPASGAEERAVRAAADFTAYLHDLIAKRRAEPGDDLLSALVSLQVAGDRLTVDELVATAVLLLNAGHEASVNVLGNGVAHLLAEPSRYARLVTEPALAPRAVEEAIRYDTPLSLFTRTVMSPVTVDGVNLEAGQVVALLLGSANRDPDAFDNPDTFDLSRWPNPHVGFGAGIHFCLGAALARVELQEAFGALVARCPDLQLDGQPRRRSSYQFRGFGSIPVRT